MTLRPPPPDTWLGFALNALLAGIVAALILIALTLYALRTTGQDPTKPPPQPPTFLTLA